MTDDHVTLEDVRRVLGDRAFAALTEKVKRRQAEETVASLESRCTEWARSVVDAGEATADDLRAIFRNVETDDQTGEIYIRGRRWALQGRASTRAATRAARPRRLDRTQERDFRLPILEALDELGGRARAEDVRPLLERKMEGKLRPDDHGTLPSNGELRWWNSAKYERKHMLRMGPPLLNPSSPRRWWELTDAGREYLRRHAS
ncbi:MAG: winged helix-turn-helix domain-containing protein [Dehalococcoidia bacterium]